MVLSKRDVLSSFLQEEAVAITSSSRVIVLMMDFMVFIFNVYEWTCGMFRNDEKTVMNSYFSDNRSFRN